MDKNQAERLIQALQQISYELANINDELGRIRRK